jgi:hypothetical protein
MPYKSGKQKKYLHANKPEVARKFASHIRKAPKNASGGKTGGAAIGAASA